MLGGVAILSIIAMQARADDHDFAARNVAAVVTEDAQSALIGRDILRAGGNAVDAATATALALGVSLPSRVSVLGGGACMINDPVRKKVTGIDFLPEDKGGKAGMPAMLRGLYAMHSRYGKLRFEQLVAPAEKLAGFGYRLSQGVRADALLAGERQGIFAQMLTAQVGQPVPQPELAHFLSIIRQQGIGSLYQGAMATELTRQTGIPAQELRTYTPTWREPVSIDLDAGYEQAMRLFPISTESSAIPSVGLVTKGTDELAVACILTNGGWFGGGQGIASWGAAWAQPVNSTSITSPAMMINPNVGEVHAVWAQGALGNHPEQNLDQAIITERKPAHSIATMDQQGLISVIACVRDGRGTGARNCSAAIASGRGGLAASP